MNMESSQSEKEISRQEELERKLVKIKKDLWKLRLNSGPEIAALREKRNKLIVEQIKNCESSSGVKTIFMDAPMGSTVKLQALDKWIDLFETMGEITSAYFNSPWESPQRKKAFKKWNELSLKEVKNAKTQKEIKKVYFNSPEGSISSQKAFKKWNELLVGAIKNAQTEEEVTKICKNAVIFSVSSKEEIKKAYYGSFDGSTFKKIVFDEWNRISLREMIKIKTVQEAEEVFMDAPMGSIARLKVLNKWIDLAKTEEELRGAYFNSLNNSRLLKKVFEKRIMNKIISSLDNLTN